MLSHILPLHSVSCYYLWGIGNKIVRSLFFFKYKCEILILSKPPVWILKFKPSNNSSKYFCLNYYYIRLLHSYDQWLHIEISSIRSRSVLCKEQPSTINSSASFTRFWQRPRLYSMKTFVLSIGKTATTSQSPSLPS